jgi:hypothetical protein
LKSRITDQTLSALCAKVVLKYDRAMVSLLLIPQDYQPLMMDRQSNGYASGA